MRPNNAKTGSRDRKYFILRNYFLCLSIPPRTLPTILSTFHTFPHYEQQIDLRVDLIFPARQEKLLMALAIKKKLSRFSEGASKFCHLPPVQIPERISMQ